jgi:Mrp family chromosome partitioning ATPase
VGTIDTLPNDEVRLHLVRDAISRHWLSILGITLLMTALGVAYTHAGTTSYTAYSRVLIRPIPGNALSDDVTSSTGQVTVAMETEASLISSPEVTELANDKLGKDVVAGSPDVVATVPSNTEIVEVAFSAPTASDAQRGAQAFAEAFLQYRRGLAESSIRYQSDSLERQARNAEAKLKTAAHAASSAAPPPDAASQVQLYASRLAALQASIGQLETLDVRPGSLVTPARLPATPTGMNPLMLSLATALIGLGAGVTLAIWRERRDDRVRSGSRPALHGVPVISRVPQTAERSVLGDPARDTKLLEAYRQAAIAVLAATRRPAVLVVSAVDDVTRTEDVAVNVAVSLRHSGHQVILVDAAGGDAGVDRLLDLPVGPGLREVLHGSVEVDEGLHELDGLRVLPVGNPDGGSDELLPGVGMADLLEKLRGEAEFVVVSAPAATNAAGTTLAVVGDGLLLVATERMSTNDDLVETLQRSRQLGVDTLGVIVAQRASRRVGRAHHGQGPSSGVSTDIDDLRALFPPPARLSTPRRLSRRRRGMDDYLLLPSRRRPRLVIPVRPRRVAASAIRRYRPPLSAADHLRRRVAALAVRLGLGSLLFGRVRVTTPPDVHPDTLVDHLSEALGQPVSFSVHLGPRRAVRKPVLQLTGDDGRTLAFAKVGTTSFTRALVRHEAEAIGRLAGRQLDRVVVPPVLDHAQWRGHELLVLGPLTGTGEPLELPSLGAAMNELARCESVRTVPLGTSRYWARVRTRLESLPETPIRRRLTVATTSIAAAHGSRCLQFGVWHGDWTPWNMTSDGDHALVWDWEKFEHDVPLGFDALHHAVQGAVVISGITPAEAFAQTRERAEELLAPFDVPAVRAQLLVSLYAIEISLRYLHDGESEAGTTPMTRVAHWLASALGHDCGKP